MGFFWILSGRRLWEAWEDPGMAQMIQAIVCASTLRKYHDDCCGRLRCITGRTTPGFVSVCGHLFLLMMGKKSSFWILITVSNAPPNVLMAWWHCMIHNNVVMWIYTLTFFMMSLCRKQRWRLKLRLHHQAVGWLPTTLQHEKLQKVPHVQSLLL